MVPRWLAGADNHSFSPSITWSVRFCEVSRSPAEQPYTPCLRQYNHNKCNNLDRLSLPRMLDICLFYMVCLLIGLTYSILVCFRRRNPKDFKSKSDSVTGFSTPEAVPPWFITKVHFESFCKMEKLPSLVHICDGESAGRVRSSHQFLKLDIRRTLNFLRVFEPWTQWTMWIFHLSTSASK